MSLASRTSDLATRIATEFKSVRTAMDANNPWGSYVVPAGRWWVGTQGATTSQAVALNATLIAPLYVPFDLKIDIARLEIVTVAGTAGSLLRLGWYKAGSDGLPDATTLKDAGSVDSTVVGMRDFNVSGAITLTKGVWWQATRAETAACNVRATNLPFAMPLPASFDPGTSQQTQTLTRTTASVGFPTSGTWGGASNAAPAKVYLKVAA